MQETYSRHRISDFRRKFANTKSLSNSKQDKAETVTLLDEQDSTVVWAPEKFLFNESSALPIDPDLVLVSRIVSSFFSSDLVMGKTYLEIESRSIFHSLRALECGAANCTIVTRSAALADQVASARRRLGHLRLASTDKALNEFQMRFDRVLAISSADDHVSLVAQCGGVPNLVISLAKLTRGFCLLGWPRADHDSAEFSDFRIRELLEKYFSKVEVIGMTSKTVLFAAFASRSALIPGDSPAPFQTADPLLSTSTYRSSEESQAQVVYTFNSSDHLLKQYNSNAAFQIERVLKCLPPENAPSLLEIGLKDGFSYIRIEKLKMLSKQEALASIDSPDKYVHFAISLLKCIEVLRHNGFVHRNLSLDSVSIRNGQPVVFDLDQISEFKPESCSSPDLRSAGEFFRFLNCGRFKQFHKLEELMLLQPIASERLAPGEIIHLIRSINTCEMPEMISKLVTIAHDLSSAVKNADRRVADHQREIAALEASSAAQASWVDELRLVANKSLCEVERCHTELEQMRNSAGWRVAVRLQKLHQRFGAPLRFLLSKVFCRL